MIKKVLPVLVALGLIAAIWQLPAWDQGVELVPPDTQPQPVTRARGLPPGHPPIPPAGGDNMAAPAQPPAGSGTADATQLPLPDTGLGSRKELDRALGKLTDDGIRAQFEEAFRLSFTSNRDARNYTRANELFKAVLAEKPQLAEAYRGMAYAEFNTTMSFPNTIALYEKAIELDGDYGEAHYALAFMLGGSDPERGRGHFAKAMALGVDDERNLGDRFYPGVN